MSAMSLAVKLLSALEEASEPERTRVLAVIRAAYPDPSAESLRTIRGRDADRKRNVRGHSRNLSQDMPETVVALSADIPRLGGKGGSDLPISDSGSPHDSYSLKLSSPEGGPKRTNPAALVEHFVAGVNDAGGVWTCASGKPFSDLAGALQPHAAAETAPLKGLAASRALGRRWFAFCGGAPRDAWKAAAWLGEGAPEKPRATAAQVQSDVQARADASRRADEAKARERDYERKKREEYDQGPPPQVQAQLAALFAVPEADSGVRKTAFEQIEELERIESK